jgi:hypothetical protein
LIGAVIEQDSLPVHDRPGTEQTDQAAQAAVRPGARATEPRLCSARSIDAKSGAPPLAIPLW